jgi:hypothetical protein
MLVRGWLLQPYRVVVERPNSTARSVRSRLTVDRRLSGGVLALVMYALVLAVLVKAANEVMRTLSDSPEPS